MRWSALVPGPVRTVLDTRRGRRLRLLVVRSVREQLDDHCQQLAAAISYHLLFSVFPLTIAGVSIVGLITQSRTRRDQVVNGILDRIPLTDAGQQQLHRLVDTVSSNAGTIGLVGVALVLYSASGVMAAIRTGLNAAWDVEQGRPFLRGKVVDLLLVLCVFVALLAALGMTILAHAAARTFRHLPHALQELEGPTFRVIAIVASFAVVFGVYLMMYRFVPSTEAKVRTVWVGALVAAVGFEALEYGFSVYVNHFAHFDRVYGSLGAIVAFLFFVYLNASVFLFGAEVASEYARLPRDPSAEDASADDAEDADALVPTTYA